MTFESLFSVSAQALVKGTIKALKKLDEMEEAELAKEDNGADSV